MRLFFNRLFLCAIVQATLVVTGGALGPASAQAQNANSRADNLPLPRFVSLKAQRVNLRIGPGRDYPVSWLYTRSGTPVEIIQEYDNWRRVRDAEGTEGWIYGSLLSGERTAVAAPWRKSDDDTDFVLMRKDGRQSAKIVAKLEPGLVVRIDSCNGEWCEAVADGTRGWVAQIDLWGAYPGEAFK